MNTVEMWQVLGISPTKDVNEITNAYRTKVVTVNPEDDAEGFMRLREAFEMAVKYAREDDIQSADGEKPESAKTDFDKHIDALDEIYTDIYKRCDIDLWKEWLSDPLCTELDTSDTMREMTLVYIMDHFMLPFSVYKLLDETFEVTNNKELLAEKFPEDFLGFIIYRMHTDEFFQYGEIIPRADFLEKCQELGIPEIHISTEKHIYKPDEYMVKNDSYIRAISNVQQCIFNYYQATVETPEDEEDKARLDEAAENSIITLKNILEYAEGFDIWNPIELGGIIRVLQLDDRRDEARKLAEGVLFHELIRPHFYATAMAVYFLLDDIEARAEVYTEEEKQQILKAAEAAVDKILEQRSDASIALMAKSMVQMIRGEYEEASDTVIEVLDDNQKNGDALILLRKISSRSIEEYKKRVEDGTATQKDKLDMAWAYFRLEKIDDVMGILKGMKVNPEEEVYYGYNNLFGRCYSMKEEFEKAEPYLARWVDMMNDMRERKAGGEEMSKKDEERISRAAFCYYMYANCLEKQNKLAQSEEMYILAIENAKDNVRDINELLFYQENYGKLLHKQEKYEQAMEVWNDMIGRIDHCVPAYIHRQETANEMRDAQLVIDDYYNIIRDFPQYSKAYVFAARVFFAYNQYEDCKNVFERAEEAGIESDMLNEVRARILDRMNNEEEAEKIYESIAKNIEEEQSDIEDVAEFYADIASFYLNVRDENGIRNKLGLASEYMEKGMKINPKFKRLLWIKTDIQEYSGQKADEVYKHMLEIFPDDPSVFYEYGEYLWKRSNGNMYDAKDMYEKTLELDPEHRVANNRLMDIYQNIFNDREDMEAYKAAVTHATRQLDIVDDEYYRIERLLLYLDGYETDKAEDDAKVAVEMRGDNVYAHNALGLCMMQRRRYDEAINHFDKAIEVMEDKETPAPYTNAAKCYEAMGLFDTGIEYLKKAMEEFGDSLNTKYIIARLYVKNKQYQDAINTYQNMVDYCKKELENTKNKWNISRIIRYMIKKVDVAIISGNDQLMHAFLDDLNKAVKDYGYMNKGLNDTAVGVERAIASDIYRQLADFHLNNLRQYKTSIEYFEKCIRFMMKAGTKGPNGSIVDDVSLVGKIFKKSGLRGEVEKPEDVEGADLKDIFEMYRYFAGACYAYGLKNWAKELANRGLKCIERKYGSIDKYLSFKQSECLRRCDTAMLIFFAGDTEKAMKLAGTVEWMPPCSFCTYKGCYDRILTLARIYELTGDIQKAIEYFSDCCEKTKDDAEIYMALRTLKG